MKVNSMKSNINVWYSYNYTDDTEALKNINANVTFGDVLKAIVTDENIYDVIGGSADSIVRDNIFSEICNLLGWEYETLTNLISPHQLM